jgi:hypothetical protein
MKAAGDGGENKHVTVLFATDAKTEEEWEGRVWDVQPYDPHNYPRSYYRALKTVWYVQTKEDDDGVSAWYASDGWCFEHGQPRVEVSAWEAVPSEAYSAWSTKYPAQATALGLLTYTAGVLAPPSPPLPSFGHGAAGYMKELAALAVSTPPAGMHPHRAACLLQFNKACSGDGAGFDTLKRMAENAVYNLKQLNRKRAAHLLTPYNVPPPPVMRLVLANIHKLALLDPRLLDQPFTCPEQRCQRRLEVFVSGTRSAPNKNKADCDRHCEWGTYDQAAIRCHHCNNTHAPKIDVERTCLRCKKTWKNLEFHRALMRGTRRERFVRRVRA